MRKGLVLLAPFALIAGLHMACSSTEARPTFEPAPASPAPSGFGEKVAEVPDASTGCSESQTKVSRIPVVIEFVVDESGSMDGFSPQDNKWPAARDALLAAFEDMKNTADPAMFVGALRFGTGIGESVKPDALTEASHYDDLKDIIDTPKAGGGGTDTEKALDEAYDIVESFKPPPASGLTTDGMNRIVVLLSDGAPSGGEAEKTRCETKAAQKFAAQAPNGPILTFAVGIGPFPATSSSYDPDFMGRIAVKGGTAPQGCSPTAKVLAGVCHFQVTPGQNADATRQALVDALNKIRALSTSCEFSFTTNENTDLSKVKVVITDKDGNETPIPQDPENGWSFDDESNPSKVILNGDACFASGGTVSGRVDVVLGCKSAN